MASALADDVPIYRFGAYELNPRSRQLLRLGRPVAIQPRPFDLLVYLVRHRDRPVPRDELLAEVWRGVHVDDEALRFTLHAARRAVGDDGTRQEVILTIPRVGYRVVAPVVEIDAAREATPRELRSDRSLSETPFLGRDVLMQEAATLLRDAKGGEGRVLLLSGEAGIGKSRALDEIATLAQGQGLGVLRGRCVESEGAPAFWPWIQILRAAVGSNPPSALLQALGAGAREVAWMVPELRSFVPELPLAPVDDARAARFILFDSVTAFLRALTAEQAFLVSIDDLHRADTASAALFQHVARELADPAAPRMLFVGTHREAELRATPPLADSVGAVAALSHARTRQIQGLALDEVATLVRALSGREPNAAAVADLHRKTNGNPFFLNQILRLLQSESRLPELDSAQSVDLELPRHVQDAIRRQLQVLSEATRETLEIASVIGGEFSLTELDRTTEVERASLLARLAPALGAGVIGERVAEPGRYRFTHALVRDVLYAGLPIDFRSRTHARVARAIESVVPSHPSVASVSIAHHYAQSPEREDIDKALHYYEQAARWSTGRGAFEDAPQHLDRALALLEGADLTATTRRCRLLLALGDALSDAGERERAREVLLDAAEIARGAGLLEELATAALRFAPDLLALETGVHDQQLVRLLQEAIAELGDRPTALRAMLIARLAIAEQWNDGRLRSKKLSDLAVRIARESRDKTALAFARSASSLVSLSMVNPKLRVSEISRENGPLGILQRVIRVTSLMVMGDVAYADQEIVRLADLVLQSRLPHAYWYVDLMRATRAEMEGRYADADELASRYLALGEKYGDRNAIHSHAAQRVMRAVDVGGIERYLPRVRRMIEDFPRMIAWRAGLCLVLAELGKLDECRSEMNRLLSGKPLARLPVNEWYVTAATLAISCGVVGDRQVAEGLYDELLPHSDQLVVFGYCTYCMGSTHRLLGNLAAVLERWELASAHYEAAVAKNNSIGARACNGRVYFEHARMLNRLGNDQAARRSAAYAAEIAHEFKMVRLEKRSTGMMGRL